MATRTYYGKLDCRSSTASGQVLVNEVYKGTMDFLTYLSSSNQVDLVSWNSGSGATAATFENRTYSDGSFPFGPGAFSLWKFKTNSRRNWDWYLYLQNAEVISSFDAVIQYSWAQPISGTGGTGEGIVASSPGSPLRGILMQSAICISGTTSFNAWNGSLSMGAGNASIAAGNGGIRWVSGSNSRRLYVLPRSNDLGGTHVIQKANATPFYLVNTSTTNSRYHFIYDGDAFQIIYDNGLNNTYSYNYVGAFELRNSLTGSGLCGSDYGFSMYSFCPDVGSEPTTTTDTIVRNASIGDTAGTGGATTVNGGIVCPINAAVSGSKSAVINILENWNTTTYQPNTLTGKYEEFPLLIGANETPFTGFLGTLNTGLVRMMRDVQVHDTTSDFSRAVFAGTTTPSNLSISTPWTGSNPPGISTDRTGSQFTWTQDYK